MNEQEFYSPILEEEFNQNKEEQQFETKCSKITCCILQVFLWIFLTLTIIFYVKDIIIYIAFLGLFIIIYLFYFFFELFSTTAKFLCNKNTKEGIYQKFGKIFRTPPIIKLYGESYHYGYGTYSPTDIKDPTFFGTRNKIITHHQSLKFNYYSVRDVSGLFYLNCEESSVNNKYYIKLELEEEINFADAISYSDYFYIKKNFCDKNSKKDVRFNYYESRIIPQMNHHNLIKFRENEPCTVNYFFFLLATFLTLAEIYKPYVNSFCIKQKFKIRKLISTRYDLSLPEYEEKFRLLNPSINLIYQNYKYDSKDYNFINKGFKFNIPKQNELEEAEKFRDQIPNYQISNGEGNIKPGVIIDKPEYSNYKNNQNNLIGDN